MSALHKPIKSNMWETSRQILDLFLKVHIEEIRFKGRVQSSKKDFSCGSLLLEIHFLVDCCEIGILLTLCCEKDV